jgi:hypothetical protein
VGDKEGKLASRGGEAKKGLTSSRMGAGAVWAE